MTLDTTTCHVCGTAYTNKRGRNSKYRDHCDQCRLDAIRATRAKVNPYHRRKHTPGYEATVKRINHVILDHSEGGICWLPRTALMERFGRYWQKEIDACMSDNALSFEFEDGTNKPMPYGGPGA